MAIALVRRDDDLRLRVKDVGIGISPELLPHIFDRFRQADSSRTRQQGGLGIGLTIARKLAEMHDGTLEAFSSGLGAGAEFILTLPAADPAEMVPGTSAASRDAVRAESQRVDLDAKPLLGRSILVVDDDGDARDILSEVLQTAGASVMKAASAKEALATFESGTFDVLVSDLGMPGEDGLTLLERIRVVDRTRGGKLTAVAVSGYGTADDRAASLRAGFHEHVVKPSDPLDLVGLLARLANSK